MNRQAKAESTKRGWLDQSLDSAGDKDRPYALDSVASFSHQDRAPEYP